MRSVLIAGCFLLLVLIPCIVAVYSSSRDSSPGDSGEHKAVTDVPAAIDAKRVERGGEASTPGGQRAPEFARLSHAAEPGTGQVAVAAARPSRVRMVAAAFSKDMGDATGPRPSRLKRVATALVYREPETYVPMVAGDPGTKKMSVRALRAKHAAAAKASRS